ncbi:plasma membrane-associated cation-binding protein 1 [Quercus lobata]|uniref:Plasma membrane-associated cation-binding protein 1 n=1 Tax=Quercus lobata TaxID=97700 RepID=A0A7N2MV42_QUELO|nr:plasma membrane-associated cation-binding protein 1 [Quercus lobata]XP_030942610.1 plasma membrane-associated cation-binding protein 1 [Quercus lobata]XP_030942611.1 plasma membrane-associated cation-binding protein 1 [Quercus lobata]
MGYWKSKVLPKIKKVFEKNGTKKSAAAAEACKSFDKSKEQITKEFEEKKTELQPKVLEIYEASSVEVKTLVKEPKEPGLKKHSVAVHKFIEELVKIEFPGSKPVSEASSKYGPALIPGPVFFVFEKVSTFVVTEEKVEPTPEAATTATEKEREIVLVEEEKKEEVVEKIEEEKKEVVVEAEKAEPTPTPTEPEAKVEEAAEPAKP